MQLCDGEKKSVLYLGLDPEQQAGVWHEINAQSFESSLQPYHCATVAPESFSPLTLCSNRVNEVAKYAKVLLSQA